MFDLTEIDAKILQFIDSCGTADTAAIKKRFPNTAIEYRLKKLSTPESDTSPLLLLQYQ